MSDISKVDQNFVVNTEIAKDDIRFYTIDEAPFKIYGIFRENDRYRRMPEQVAEQVSEGVKQLHANTAGGRVRFVTDSSYVAIHAEMDNLYRSSHMTVAAANGFDLYVGTVYENTFMPPVSMEDGYESVVSFPTSELREITIHFPLYSDVKKLYIGLQKEAVLKESAPYINTKPIVYYGSSITQGGCASRPGMSYQSIIARRFNYDFINLGFAGSAKAEDAIIDYIKQLDMSLFVYDYDHNAPTVEHLRNTHEKMFHAIRKEHPNLPIIIMSRSNHLLTEEAKVRRDIIEKTYTNALSTGDSKVYFLDGEALTELCKNDGTVDGCHPTDFGFASMAKALGDVIEKITL